MTSAPAMQRAETLRTAKDYRAAIVAYQEAARDQELPEADICLKIARCHVNLGDDGSAITWLARVVDAAETFTHWQAAATALQQITARHEGAFPKTTYPVIRRTARLGLLGSYTTAQLVPMLRLAALREGIDLRIHEADYGQYRQAIIDPASSLHAFKPEFIMLAVQHRDAVLPVWSNQPDNDVDQALTAWTSLWDTCAQRSKARIIQHNFALPVETPMGHLSARLSGSRASMLQRLNLRLGEAAATRVSIVDCDRIASAFGRERWFDDKYWHLSKQAVSLEAMPTLARHCVAVLAADLGLSKKCLALDLDNTLWGGVIGEDGLAGIRLGAGNPEGEAYIAFQEYILDLKARGVILAVCSKNNDSDAREPFLKHPDMRLKLDDFAIFVANWKTKVENLRHIAATLNIGLDSIVFADDNTAEREVIRQMLPEVEVLPLPADPARYVRTLAKYPMFETSAFTKEDAQKTRQYRAKAQIADLQASSGSIEDFHRSLQMTAEVAPFDDLHLPRIVQLIGKTNQFNLTTRRHSMEAVRAFITDRNVVHLYLKLRDRFADHGLVSILIARKEAANPSVIDIDTWLMSCRVIGRTVETEMLAQLCTRAAALGCTKLRGQYIPTAKNQMAKDVYSQFGFQQVKGSPTEDGPTTWEYDLTARGPITNGFISPATFGQPGDMTNSGGAENDS